MRVNIFYSYHEKINWFNNNWKRNIKKTIKKHTRKPLFRTKEDTTLEKDLEIILYSILSIPWFKSIMIFIVLDNSSIDLIITDMTQIKTLYIHQKEIIG